MKSKKIINALLIFVYAIIQAMILIPYIGWINFLITIIIVFVIFVILYATDGDDINDDENHDYKL